MKYAIEPWTENEVQAVRELRETVWTLYLDVKRSCAPSYAQITLRLVEALLSYQINAHPSVKP